MTRVVTWVGAGVFTAGLSAAILAGAGTAHADEGGTSKPGTKPSATQNDTTDKTQPGKMRSAKPRTKSEQRTKAADTKQRLGHRAESVSAKARKTIRDVTRDAGDTVRKIGDATRDVVEDTTAGSTAMASQPADVRARPPIKIRPVVSAPNLPAPTADKNDPVETVHDVLRTLGELTLNPEPQNYPKPLSVITDAVFDTLATLERAVGGDPVVPPELRDAVEVSTSTLVISEGHEVESNWYFPTSENGEPPTRMIYLQHGFLANGPLYSYTASYLAHTTNSVVVTTTFSSNPFEADGMWLGGDNLHEAVAQLFLDPDRTALNASMDTAELKAGHAENLDVPLQFVLVGHSLGGGFAPGVAGYYAEGLTRRREQGLDAPNELAGVVIYDAVPMGTIIPDAMDRLDELETNGTTDPGDDDPDDYIPIYEIGAPLNFLNVFSDVNDQLSEARPGQFTGVVLEGGVHMDPMQGGNPLIQVAAYAIAGFPQPENPLAVRELSAGWINDMFDEKIDPETGACDTDCAGQYGDGDDSFTITTDKGEAVAVLIGTQQASDLTSLRAISATDFITSIPAGVLNGLRTTCDLLTGGKCSV